jgi:predicted peroxiredoxin
MRVLYLSTAGSSDPTRASLALHAAANGSVEIGQECALALAGDGTELASQARAEHVEGVGVPPVRELLRKLVDNQVPIFV